MRIAAFVFLLLTIFSCRKESFTTSPDALLATEADTLHFDTVFTTTGSVTQRFKIFNDNSKGIHVGTIQLKGGISSPFKINANGIAGPVINNIDVAGDDSLYVFVSVTINPNTANLPFIIRDSIEVWYNGNKKTVQLEAYGRNAHFFRSRLITSDETWNNDLPYVIMGGIQIESNTKLTINEGCKVYMHADAPMVVNGTLEVQGKKYDSTRVVFTGDRLDDPYRDYPAAWPGIYFNPDSKNNVINYALIKNAYQAVVVLNSSADPNPKLVLSQTVIDNAYDIGLLGINAKITGQNLLVSNCGKNLVLVNGGTYLFTHCTVASYSNRLIMHKEPVLLISDYVGDTAPNALDAIFRNCVFWGDDDSKNEEISINKKGSNFKAEFDHVLWKANTMPANVTKLTAALNLNPQFDSINTERSFYDFHINEKKSPAVNNGTNTSITLDLDGNIRPVGVPDLGCYEKQ